MIPTQEMIKTSKEKKKGGIAEEMNGHFQTSHQERNTSTIWSTVWALSNQP